MSSFSGGDAPAPTPRTPPSAVRATSPGWRDPRLWIGVAIVAVSVVVGARVLASADDTVEVWAVADDVGTLRAGQVLAPDDLESRRVRFEDDAELGRYYRVDDVLPDQLTLVRGLGDGELLPRSAIGETTGDHRAEISLEVSPGQVPPDVGPGSVVDVYLVASDGQGTGGSGSGTGIGGGSGSGTGGGSTPSGATAALSGVSVVAAPAADDTFTPTGGRQLVLSVDDDAVAPYYRLLGSLADPTISVVNHP